MSSSHIVFEGIDGSGKTTQLELASGSAARSGKTPIELAEPTHGKHGLQIRNAMARGIQIPLAEQRRLFTLDRKEHVEQKIAPLRTFVANHRGFLILQDRYYFSAPAYQADSDDDVIPRLHEQQAFAPKPDIFLILDLAPDVALARIASERKTRLFEDISTLETARRRYLMLAEERSENAIVIDADRPPDVVHSAVMDVLRLDKVTNGES